MRQIRGEINAINAEMEESQNQEKQIEGKRGTPSRKPERRGRRLPTDRAV